MNAAPKRKRIRKHQRLDWTTSRGVYANTHDQINSFAGELAEKLKLMISPEGPNYEPDLDDDELVELLEGIKWLAELAHKGVKGKQPLRWDEDYPNRKRLAALEEEVFVPQRILYLEYVDEGMGKKNATAKCVGEALERAKELGIETTEREVRRLGHFDRLLVEQNKAKRRPKR